MTLPPFRSRLLPLLGAVLALAGTTLAQQPATQVLVADRDAEVAADPNGGALFNVDLTAPITADPALEAAFSLGARFEYLSAVALGPTDLRAYLTDLGLPGPGGGTPGAIHQVDGFAGASVLSRDPLLVEPWDLVVLPDGRLVVVDSESDPSALGDDSLGGNGHGAVFFVDPTSGVTTLLSDGRRHPTYPGVAADESIFEDPVSVAYDAASNVLYVADNSANPLNLVDANNDPIYGAIFAVSLDDGRVTVVSASPFFFSIVRVAVRPDGKLLVIDALLNDFNAATVDSVVFLVDPTNTNITSNVVEYSKDARYGLLEDVAVDAAGIAYVVDSGVFQGGVFLIDPRLWRIDESLPLTANAVVENETFDFRWPVGAETVANIDLGASPPTVPRTQPAACGAIVMRLEGEGLSPGLRVDLDGGATVIAARFPVGDTSGRFLELELAPIAVGTYDITLTHPFGETKVFPGALTIADLPVVVPAPPCSPIGDANCDSIVDGLDLAILGRHYGASVCTPTTFYNDADFDNDDFIDGDDLAILATFFGTF